MKQYVVIDGETVLWSAQLIQRLTLKGPHDRVAPAEVVDCLKALDRYDPLKTILREAGCSSP